MTGIQECVLYRGFEKGEILDKMTELMDVLDDHPSEIQKYRSVFYQCVNGLLETAGSYGFSGNLWHNYLTLLLVNHENAFSTGLRDQGSERGHDK